MGQLILDNCRSRTRRQRTINYQVYEMEDSAGKLDYDDIVAMIDETDRLHVAYRIVGTRDEDFLLVSEINDLLSIQRRILKDLADMPGRTSPRMREILAEALDKIRSRRIDVSSARELQFALLSEAYRSRLLTRMAPTMEAESFLQLLEEFL